MQKENEFLSKLEEAERLEASSKPGYSTLLMMVVLITTMNQVFLNGMNTLRGHDAMTVEERIFLNRVVTSLMSFWEAVLYWRLKGGSRQEIENSFLEFSKLTQAWIYDLSSTGTINSQAEAKPSTPIGADQTKSNVASKEISPPNG